VAGDRWLADRAGRVIGGIRDPKTNQALRTKVPHEMVVKPFFQTEDICRKRIAAKIPAGFTIGRSQMTALVQALSRLSASTDVETETLKLLAILSGAGLFVSILFATYGLDLSPGFF
jgi:hypothetical protein